MKNVFAALQGRELPPGFHWLNEPREWGFCEQGLIIQAEPGTDYFNDPTAGPVKANAHFLYTEQDRDFTFSARVQSEMLADYDAAAMMIMVDENNWGKLCYEFTYKKPMIVSVVTKGLSDDCNSSEVPSTGVYLRITRFADCFAFHYSLDGQWWWMIRYFNLPSPGPIKVGVAAQSPTGEGCSVQIAQLNVLSQPIREIRSGR